MSKKTHFLTTLLILFSLLLTALPVLAGVPEATDWLHSQQNDDGSFGDHTSSITN